MTAVNPLLTEKVSSMELDDGLKQLIFELFEIESNYGADPNMKKRKENEYRKCILERMPR